MNVKDPVSSNFSHVCFFYYRTVDLYCQHKMHKNISIMICLPSPIFLFSVIISTANHVTLSIYFMKGKR